MKNIIWLASYPKSGNTWLRLILSELIYSKNNFDFELLKNIGEFENPHYYDFVKKIKTNDFEKLNEIQTLCKYWIKSQIEFNKKNKIKFFKTHASNISYNKNDYTSPDTARGVIYIIRDPRDVVISYSKHLNKSIDDVIEIIQKQNTLAFSSIGKYLLLPILASVGFFITKESMKDAGGAILLVGIIATVSMLISSYATIIILS